MDEVAVTIFRWKRPKQKKQQNTSWTPASSIAIFVLPATFQVFQAILNDRLQTGQVQSRTLIMEPESHLQAFEPWVMMIRGELKSLGMDNGHL